MVRSFKNRMAALERVEGDRRNTAAQWALDRMTDAEVDHVLAYWRRAIRSPGLDPNAGPETAAIIRFIELAEERYAQL